MGTLAYRLRLLSLLSAGALAVHQLRYLIAYGDRSHQVLAWHGHAYLTPVMEGMGVLLLLTMVAFFAHLFKTLRASVHEPTVLRASRLWILGAASLVGVYGLQELVEGQLESNHPAGFGAIFGHGGWIALPLAIAIAGVVALLMRGASAVIEHASRGTRGPVGHRGELATPLFSVPRRVAPDPVSAHLAGRGPPLIVV